MSTYWNYRVIEFTAVDCDPFRQIHEVHYDDNGKPQAYSENPAVLMWDASEKKAALEILDKMKEALNKPVLITTDFYT